MPQGADWAIIDGQGGKKYAFSLKINHVNGPLGRRSSVPNALIREEVDNSGNVQQGTKHTLD